MSPLAPISPILIDKLWMKKSPNDSYFIITNNAYFNTLLNYGRRKKYTI